MFFVKLSQLKVNTVEKALKKETKKKVWKTTSN